MLCNILSVHTRIFEYIYIYNKDELRLRLKLENHNVSMLTRIALQFSGLD